MIAGFTASLTATSVFAFSLQPDPTVGEQHEIIVSYETSQQGSDGSSGSSSGQDALVERVVAVGSHGLELEFDLPLDATAEDRARVWQYPARVLQPSNGAVQLLNAPELEGRVDRWLATAGLTREMCGRWIFTWNAFRIECDPTSVIADIEAFNLLGVDVREGAMYRHPEGIGAPLSRKTDGAGGSVYSANLEVDVDAVRRARAEGDVAIGEMMQQPVTLESALHERSDELITGTVKINIEVDPLGRPTRRVVVTTLETVKPDGVSEIDRRTVTVERRLVAEPVAR